jgi:hypothetical protein
MHDIAVTDPQSRRKRVRGLLEKFLGKERIARLLRVKGHVLDFTRRCSAAIRFDTLSWQPSRPGAGYLNYYPDGFSASPRLTALYRRWIRGNKTNNNGDASRFIALLLNLQQLLDEGIHGDFAELGVWKGNSAAILADFAAKSNVRLFLFDTFKGFDQRDFVGVDRHQSTAFTDTSIDYVRETVGDSTCTTYVPGFFPESLTGEVRQRTFALAHIDCDLYGPMKAALEFFYPRMPRGGMLILHDYSSGCWAGAKSAVDEFCAATGEFIVLWPDKSGTAMIRKSH